MTRRELIRAANYAATVLSVISLVVLMIVRTPDEVAAPVVTEGAAAALVEADAGGQGSGAIRRLRAVGTSESPAGEGGQAAPLELGMVGTGGGATASPDQGDGVQAKGETSKAGENGDATPKVIDGADHKVGDHKGGTDPAGKGAYDPKQEKATDAGKGADKGKAREDEKATDSGNAPDDQKVTDSAKVTDDGKSDPAPNGDAHVKTADKAPEPKVAPSPRTVEPESKPRSHTKATESAKERATADPRVEEATPQHPSKPAPELTKREQRQNAKTAKAALERHRKAIERAEKAAEKARERLERAAERTQQKAHRATAKAVEKRQRAIEKAEKADKKSSKKKRHERDDD